MLNLLHISDLHYTAQATGKVRDQAIAGANAILNLVRDLKGRGVLSSKACVCITGDLVQSGQANVDGLRSDFDAVDAEFLKPLMQILQIDASRVFIAPGNHEMDRVAIETEKQINALNLPIKKPCENDLNADLCGKLDTFFEFIDLHGYQSVSRENPRIRIFEIDGQSVVSLNGLAGAYSLDGFQDKGHLYILSSEFGGGLAKIPHNSIVLLHHPLSWFEDQCGTDLKDFLAARQCRLLTGHIHDQGVDWLETSKGTLAVVQAGASAEGARSYQIGVGWFPPSNSAAVRHYTFQRTLGGYPITDIGDTRVVPATAKAYFERSEAFFDAGVLDDCREKGAEKYKAELKVSFGGNPEGYIPPDLAIYSEDEFSARRISLSTFRDCNNIRVLSGQELSGKTSFLHYSAMMDNTDINCKYVSVVLDFRAIAAGRDLSEHLVKELVGLGLSHATAQYALSVGLVNVWVDNFDPDNAHSVMQFDQFISSHPSMRWNIAVKGGQRFMPSRAPATFPKDAISYFELSEVTAPTVVRMIESHDGGRAVERPRAVVERVFRSINNLRAPRTVFYVHNLVDIFLNDGSVEPLNRYLLIENLLAEKIRSAHRRHLPYQAIDMDMLDTFIGQISHYLLINEKPYLSKAEYYSLAENFVEKKGLQKKRFEPDSILAILSDGFVLRDYDGSYGFMMLSVEDYYLAKHMSRDEKFRDSVMSADGLQKLPSVAEYYIAQNPSDRSRIQQIFNIIEEFEQEVWPLMDQIEEEAVEAIASAAPGSMASLQDEVLDILGEVEAANGNSDGAFVVSELPEQVGKTRRLKYAAEERGAIFMQLGASILGVTRTLDQSERIEIFSRMRKVMLVCFYTIPFIAHHLADGHELKFRGITVKADYVGALAVQDDRFYIILRGMLFNSLKQFATWAGSPSFYNAAVELRRVEENEVIRSILLAQNIEADLAEATEFVPTIADIASSTVFKEALVRLYVDAMTLVPLDRADEARAIEHLVDATIALKPPKNSADRSQRDRQKTKVRQDLMDRVGISAYVGKLVKPVKKG